MGQDCPLGRACSAAPQRELRHQAGAALSRLAQRSRVVEGARADRSRALGGHAHQDRGRRRAAARRHLDRVDRRCAGGGRRRRSRPRGLARERSASPIQFWDANATKALHVGHLRNLALGNALAAALEQGGGEIERRSLISDAGRCMGEAMAGMMRSGRHAQSWPDGDQKSDHFVGLCYADYVAAGGMRADREIEERGDSLTRELRMQNDAADELLNRVMAGESEALGAVVQDARLGDLRSAQDAGPPRRGLRPGVLRVRLPGRRPSS